MEGLHGREVVWGLLVNKDQVHGIRLAPVGREPANPLEEVRVGVARDARVRRVVTVGPKGVSGHQARCQLGGLPASVARVRVGVVLDVARGEMRDERVDAGVAGQEGDVCIGGGGALLVDCAVGVEAVHLVGSALLSAGDQMERRTRAGARG